MEGRGVRDKIYHRRQGTWADGTDTCLPFDACTGPLCRLLWVHQEPPISRHVDLFDQWCWGVGPPDEVVELSEGQNGAVTNTNGNAARDAVGAEMGVADRQERHID